MKEIKKDLDLKDYTLDKLPLLKELKNRCQEAKTEVCVERAKYITQYMMKPDDPYESPELMRAKAVANYMRKRKALFLNDNLIAGSTSSKELGAPVYPEFVTGLSIWPELDSISTRSANPQLLSNEEPDKDADTLNFDVFPYWLDRAVLEATRAKARKEGDKDTLEGITLTERLLFFLAGKAGCISHTTPFYEKVLAKGLQAMIQEAHEEEEKTDVEEREKKDFFQAMQIAMQGIIDYATNLSQKANEMASKADSEEKKKHFQEIATVCSHVPAQPASSFREAINSLWLCHVGVLAENINMAMGPGRLDQVLYPYFKKDIEAGKLTIEEALNLIGCFWFKVADNTNLVPASAETLFGGAGSVPAVTLGGIDKDGKDAVNDLTYLMLRVTELLCIKDPNVNARCHTKINDQDYLDRVSRVIINTKAIPAIFNDINNIETLEKQGVKTEHARDYAVIGCVELGSAGREYSASSSILLNLTAAMDMTFFEGKRPYITDDWQIGPVTKLEEMKTFKDFKLAFQAQLKTLIEKAIDLNEALGKMHQELLPSPLMSCFFEGPLEKGRDLIFGGALYNSSGATHVGFADVCDSLNAVECAVYRDKIVTLEEMKDALEKNFEGYEKLHAYVKNPEKVPKYGMDDSTEDTSIAVKNSKELIKFLYDTYQAHTNYRGGKYRPAYWTMTNHAGLGAKGMALPSGRKAYEVFSSGITPASQCAQNLTDAYLSVAKLNSQHIPGGVALNMKYTPAVNGNGDTKKYQEEFRQMVESYFAAGGMQVQYNIETYERLAEVAKDPSLDPYLIVRVSGYSAYFKDLNKYMKRELITRTQYDLGDNKAVPLTIDLNFLNNGKKDKGGKN